MPRDVVYGIMDVVDPKGLKDRKPNKKTKQKRGKLESPGVNFVFSLDGHDKLMGYQNSTFPLAVYGCMNTCSRKIMWMHVWTTNSNPALPAFWYARYLEETHILAMSFRLDKGTEATTIGAFHAFLLARVMGYSVEDAADSVTCGPSISNRVRLYVLVMKGNLKK